MVIRIGRFNRTFMELKYMKTVVLNMVVGVLIVPLWN